MGNFSLDRITNTISITSGKGGVGKSTIASNIAYDLSTKGKKVLILDGDMGMANVDIMFGVRSTHSIMDVLNGRMCLEEILVKLDENIFLIPGGSGIKELTEINAFQRRTLLDSVSQMNQNFDYFIIDTAPGIGDNVLYLNSAVQMPAVVITPEPSSLADSYALIKLLNQNHKVDQMALICNQVRDEKEGLGLFQRFNEIVGRFLYISLDYWGSIPQDPRLRRATHMQRLVLKQDVESEAAQSLIQISKNIQKNIYQKEHNGGLQMFWENYVGVA